MLFETSERRLELSVYGRFCANRKELNILSLPVMFVIQIYVMMMTYAILLAVKNRQMLPMVFITKHSHVMKYLDNQQEKY